MCVAELVITEYHCTSFVVLGMSNLQPVLEILFNNQTFSMEWLGQNQVLPLKVEAVKFHKK